MRQLRGHCRAAIRQLHDDLNRTKKWHLHWRGGLCVVIGGVLIGLLFNHFGRSDLERPTLVSITVLVFIIAVKWKLRARLWFWVTITFFAMLHVLLIASLTWPKEWVPALVLIGAAWIDMRCWRLFLLLSNSRKRRQFLHDKTSWLPDCSNTWKVVFSECGFSPNSQFPKIPFFGSWLTRYDPRKSIHPITIDMAIKPLPTSLGIHHIDSSHGSNSG